MPRAINESASPADVTQLLLAFNTTSSPSTVAVPKGAQKWLRDPVSEPFPDQIGPY